MASHLNIDTRRAPPVVALDDIQFAGVFPGLKLGARNLARPKLLAHWHQESDGRLIGGWQLETSATLKNPDD